MRKWRPFPLPDGSYSDDTRPWSQQDVVNYLPTKAELPGARSGTKYVPVPGMTVFAKIGYGPYRGMRDVEGKLFVVAGNRLFRIMTTGIAIPIGTIPGTARVSMTHNQVDGGNQLLIGTRDNSYLYDSTTDTLAATGIPLQSVDFLNQRFLGIDSQRRFWRYSDLADGSSDAWNTLNNESAESSPDRIVGGIVAAGYWWAFGERTIEVFANAPSGNTTFSRLVVIEKGCANAETIKRLNDTIIFLGSDFILYRMEGYNAIPISTKAQTEAFRQCDPAKALAYTYEDNGYLIYYLTFQDGQTWGYDITNQRWHRRQSFGLNRWRINALCKWNGDWYAGDYSNDTLYKLKWRYAYEGEDIFPRLIRSGVMHNNGNRMRVHGLKLLANTGLPESLPSVAQPILSAQHAAVDLVTTADGGEFSLNTTFYTDLADFSCTVVDLQSAQFVSGIAYAWDVYPDEESSGTSALSACRNYFDIQNTATDSETITGLSIGTDDLFSFTVSEGFALTGAEIIFNLTDTDGNVYENVLVQVLQLG